MLKQVESITQVELVISSELLKTWMTVELYVEFPRTNSFFFKNFVRWLTPQRGWESNTSSSGLHSDTAEPFVEIIVKVTEVA